MPRRRRQRGGDDDDDDESPPSFEDSNKDQSVNVTEQEKEAIKKADEEREKAEREAAEKKIQEEAELAAAEKKNETRKRIEATRDEWLRKHKYNGYHEYVGYIEGNFKPLCIDTTREQCYKGYNPNDENDVPWKQDTTKTPADLPQQGGNKRKSKKRKSRKQRKSKKTKRKSKGRRL
jgi:hypothetical protein